MTLTLLSPKKRRGCWRKVVTQHSCNEAGMTLSDETKRLLDGANFAHLATLMPDGSPQSVPVWAGREGDRIVICTGETSLKARNTARDPRVALSIIDFRDPYSEVQIRRAGCRAPS